MDDLSEDDMPQPLYKVNTEAEVFTGFGQDPEKLALCPYITRVIGAWAYSDHLIACMLNNFLKADYAVTAAMYNALTSAEARKAAFLAAAKLAVPDRYDLIQAVLAATRPSRRRRNDFAHHVWAHSPQIDEALLLVDPAALTEQIVAVRQFVSEGRFQPKTSRVEGVTKLEFPALPAVDGSRIFVFKRKELEFEAIAAEQCTGTFHILNLSTSTLFPDDEARDMLEREPRIQRELKKLCPQNDPGPQPPPPEQTNP
jgi:hypothetical protein